MGNMKHVILLSFVLDCVGCGVGLFRAGTDAGNSAGMTNRETLEFALGEPHSPALRVDFSDTGEGLNRDEFSREGLNVDARCSLRSRQSSDGKTGWR